MCPALSNPPNLRTQGETLPVWISAALGYRNLSQGAVLGAIPQAGWNTLQTSARALVPSSSSVQNISGCRAQHRGRRAEGASMWVRWCAGHMECGSQGRAGCRGTACGKHRVNAGLSPVWTSSFFVALRSVGPASGQLQPLQTLRLFRVSPRSLP